MRSSHRWSKLVGNSCNPLRNPSPGYKVSTSEISLLVALALQVLQDLRQGQEIVVVQFFEQPLTIDSLNRSEREDLTKSFYRKLNGRAGRHQQILPWIFITTKVVALP